LLIVLALAIGFGLWYKVFRHALPAANVPAALLLVTLNNHTGDSTLDGIFQAGVPLDLMQSPHLSVRGRSEVLTGAAVAGVTLNPHVDPSTDDARDIARAVGATAIAFGNLEKTGAQYTITMRVLDVASGNQLKNASEIATSRDQLPDAIDRITSDVRLSLGETGDSISASLVPLVRDASGNLDALAAYAIAEDQRATGHIDDAANSYERAATLDSKFTQAFIELADIRSLQHAEVESANAATKAQENASGAGMRTQKLARALYALDTLGDTTQAINILQNLCATYTTDIQSRVLLAMTQRLAGRYADSLATSQVVLGFAPYNSRARLNAELAMIALDQLSNAESMEASGVSAGMPHPAVAALIALLSPDSGATASDGTAQDIATKITYATVLDAGGKFAAGLAMWQDVVARTHSASGTASAASYAMAHAALDRAMAADCVTTHSLLQAQTAQPSSGPQALYLAGIANALCNNIQAARLNLDALTVSSKQSVVAANVLQPVLNSVVQWKTGEVTAALSTLNSIWQSDAGRNDSLWLAPYLTGVIELDQKQAQKALTPLAPIVDPQYA
ncbi:MAG: hypothetical protein ABI142_11520, partial [Bryocella sp.]